VLPVNTTTYSVAGSNTAGCIGNQAVISVSVIPLPNIIITGSNSTCQGDSVTLTAGGAMSYTWNTNSNSSSIVISPSVTTSYSLLGSNAFGCINYAMQTITVIPLPTVSISGPTISCEGYTVVLNANGAQSYLWSTSSTTNTISVFPSVTTSYTVFGTDSFGCTNHATQTLSVVPLPIVNVSGTSTVCLGASLSFTASGANTYTWSTASGQATISITPTASGSYTVTGSNVLGCAGVSIIKTVTVFPLPPVTATSNDSLICAGETATLSAGGAWSYTWSNGSITQSPIITPSLTTTFTVTGQDSVGCINQATIIQQVAECVGLLANEHGVNQITVFPNPGNGLFLMQFSSLAENTSVELYNALGALILKESINTAESEINIVQVANGIYFLRIFEDQKQVMTIKLVKGQ
jgi:hypothetical protein